jgi:hypothetical protein
MKKILLIIFFIMIIFQMITLATAIDVGSEAINRSTYNNEGTSVDRNNPANASGTITSVEIYANSAMSNVEVATFFVVSGNNLSTRDSEAIGSVAAGYTTHTVSLNIVTGDCIGIYFSAGGLDRDTTGGGFWKNAGDQIPCTNVLFTLTANGTLSIYGAGATVTGIKWNTVTISKWNGQVITKLNGMP